MSASAPTSLPPRRTWRAALLRRLKRALLVFAVLVIAHTIYTRSFSPEAEDWPGQRAALVKRTVAPLPVQIERTQLLADVQELASAKYAGRRVDTAGNQLAQDYLVGRLQAIGVPPLLAEYRQPFEFQRRRIRQFWTGGITTRGTNLLAVIEGRELPQQRLLMSAHYDHLGERNGQIYPGADDNASGVAAVLAAAAHFKAHPPRHTIVFALFDAEESGLAGARHFVTANTVPLDSIRLIVNLDMISRSDANELFVAGTHQNPDLRRLIDPLRAASAITVLYGHDQPRPIADTDDWVDASDHGPFHAAGVPFLYLGVPDHAGYHRPGDTFAAIHPGFFVEAANFALNVLVAADTEH